MTLQRLVFINLYFFYEVFFFSWYYILCLYFPFCFYKLFLLLHPWFIIIYFAVTPTYLLKFINLFIYLFSSHISKSCGFNRTTTIMLLSVYSFIKPFILVNDNWKFYLINVWNVLDIKIEKVGCNFIINICHSVKKWVNYNSIEWKKLIIFSDFQTFKFSYLLLIQ